MAKQSWLEKAERYLTSAQMLLRENDLDSSVSRAYYTSRYLCLHFLAAEGLKVDRGWLHEAVLNETITRARNKQWLRRIIMVGQPDFAKSLHESLKLRGDADYGQSAVSERQARRALDFAQALSQAVRENIS